MEELLKENIELLITIGSTMIAIVIGALGIQRYFHSQKVERITERNQTALEGIKVQHAKEMTAIQKAAEEEKQSFKKELEEELKKKMEALQTMEAGELKQEVKMVYVKYLHIRRESEEPVYRKYIPRLEETIDVHSEYHYYRFNKYTGINNSITITDRSSGIVDTNILYPWKELVFTDLPSRKIKGIISQEIGGYDTYFSATTYYNGFKENNEDIGSKMEMETQSARMIADFSSIVGLKNLFTKEPDAYKMELDGRRTKLLGLEKLNEGVYHIEARNLKKGEALLLDFHVNWDYLNDD